VAQATSGLRAVLSARWAYSTFQRLVGVDSYYEHIVTEYIKVQSGERVLDIGCGPADILRHLGDVHYVGFDTETRYISSASARWRSPKREFMVGGVDDPWNDVGPFDVALAIGVVHHLGDDQVLKLHSLAKRVLRPGGRLVTVDPCLEAGQPLAARAVIKADRGQNVRTPQEYARLAATTFENVRLDVRRDLLRIPYSHAILTTVGADPACAPAELH
jgi:SAM-dependent methyltransferase